MKKLIFTLFAAVCLIGCAGLADTIGVGTPKTKQVLLKYPSNIKKPVASEDTMLWILIYTTPKHKTDILNFGNSGGRSRVNVNANMEQFGSSVAIPDAATLDEFLNTLENMYPNAVRQYAQLSRPDFAKYYDVIYDIENAQELYDYTQFLTDCNVFVQKLTELERLENKKAQEQASKEHLAWWNSTKTYTVSEINKLYQENAVKFMSEWRQNSYKVKATVGNTGTRVYRSVIVFPVAKPIYNGLNVISVSNIVCYVSQEDASKVKSGQTVTFEMKALRHWNDIRALEEAVDHYPGDLIASCAIPY